MAQGCQPPGSRQGQSRNPDRGRGPDLVHVPRENGKEQVFLAGKILGPPYAGLGGDIRHQSAGVAFTGKDPGLSPMMRSCFSCRRAVKSILS